MAIAELDDILSGLLHLGADRVTLERTSGGIEVTIYRDSTGVGGELKGPLAAVIMEELVSRAKLQRRSKGLLRARIRGGKWKFVVREYDHFGESAFEIRQHL